MSSQSYGERTARASARRSRVRRRRAVLLFILIATTVIVGADLVRRGVSMGQSVTPLGAEPTPTAPLSGTPSPSSPPSVAPSPTPDLTAAGAFPTDGPNTWVYGTTQGDVLGTAGTVRRFRIAIETGISQDLTEFAAKIDATLGDPRSWIAGRQYRLQRVASGSAYEFTIYLATQETAREMCIAGGVDIRVGGVPYTSCRTSGRVIINLTRWMLSVPGYVDNKIPLDEYRTYVINHETGHQLGHNHELCPGAGKPAPVMQTQTLDLKGCTANAWPYLDGKRYFGAPAPR